MLTARKRNSSPIKSLKDLVDKVKADPGSVSWGGGSAGGTDHILAGMILSAVGVDPAKVNYIPYAGGGEAQAAILGGHVTVGVSGYEVVPRICKRRIRWLLPQAVEIA